MIQAKLVLYTRDGAEEVTESLRVCPREGEHIFRNEIRYRVIQVQHHIERVPQITVIAGPP